MSVRLTEGAISLICSGKWKPEYVKPVLQVTDIRPVRTQTASTGNKERYSIQLSDGSFRHKGMLATQVNDLVRSQQLRVGSVVRLNDFSVSTILNRMILIIFNVDVILSTCDIIGDEKPFSSTPNSESSTLTGAFSQLNIGVNSPLYPPRHEQNAGPNSYAMAHAPTMLSYPPANTNAVAKIIPIAALNPYQYKWTIEAYVTEKRKVTHLNNANEVCKVVSFDLLDSDGGKIRATCFNAEADRFYDQIEVGKVYFISNGNIQPAQQAFKDLNSDHVITLDCTSTVQPCFDDTDHW